MRTLETLERRAARSTELKARERQLEAELGRATQNALGRAVALDPATIQGVVARLRDRGLVAACEIARAVEKAYRDELIGFADGWRGVIEGDALPLTSEGTRGILPRGGTILGSSRTNPFKIDGGVERIKDNLAAQGRIHQHRLVAHAFV